MVRALIIAAALALAACTSAPSVPMQAAGQGNIAGFATLAVWGEWESDLAPAYTRLAVIRHRAARALDARRIGVETAVAIQKTADQARRLLDESRRGNTQAPTLLQRALLAEAQRLMDTAETLLEQRP